MWRKKERRKEGKSMSRILLRDTQVKDAMCLYVEFCVPGQPRWLSGLAPPSAQGLILETWD